MKIEKRLLYEHCARYLKRFIIAKRMNADHVFEAYDNFLVVLRTLQASGIFTWDQVEKLKFSNVDADGTSGNREVLEHLESQRLEILKKFLDNVED